MRLAGARAGKETSKSTHSFSTKQTHRDAGNVEMIANDLRTLRSHFLKHSELFVFQLKKNKIAVNTQTRIQSHMVLR